MSEPQPDPVVQALEVAARILQDWPPNPPLGEWDPAPFRPGGDRYIPKLVTYGTHVTPTAFIPIPPIGPSEVPNLLRPIPFERQKTPAELREEAAAEVRAVLREAGVLEP